MASEERERAIEMHMKLIPMLGVVFATVGPALVVVVVAGVLLFVFKTMLDSSAEFRQVLAATAYAWLPNVISMMGALAVMFLQDPVDFDLKNPAGFNLAFYLDPKTTPAWLMSPARSLDVFAKWVALLLGTGMAVLTGKRWSSALIGVLIPWCGWILIRMGWTAIFG